MVLGQDTGELWERFFGFVFVIVGDEHDLLALAGSVGADVGERGVRRAGDEANEDETEQSEGAHGLFYYLMPTGVNPPLRLTRLTLMP